jgi:hypothetical protein
MAKSEKAKPAAAETFGTTERPFRDGALLTADNATLVVAASKDGKLRVSSLSWMEPVVTLPGSTSNSATSRASSTSIARRPDAALRPSFAMS